MKPFIKPDLSKLGLPGFDMSKFDLSKLDLSKVGLRGDARERAARLAEAMAEIGRKQAAAYARWAADQRAGQAADHGASAEHVSTLDMEAPNTPGGAWTAPGAAREAPDHGTPPPDPSGIMRKLRDALPEGVIPPGLRPKRAAPAVPPGARFEARSFTGPAGTRTYKVYVPSGFRGQPLPVVVMLHGCTQDPDDFAAGTRMNAVAEEQTFLVAYPAQSKGANAQRCWNWYAAADQSREGGEPELIAGIARAVVAEFSADPARVYAAGLSAGGAEAAILAATYPDLFAAVGVHSGLACGAARDVPSAFAAMKGSGSPARGNRRAVPTIVFHGDGDRTVHPANGDRVAAQAAAGADLKKTVTEGRTPDGVAYTRTVRVDAAGRPMLEQWVLHGAGHAWSGGSPDGSFTDPRGPDASREMARFFRAHASDAPRP